LNKSSEWKIKGAVDSLLFAIRCYQIFGAGVFYGYSYNSQLTAHCSQHKSGLNRISRPFQLFVPM
jgi:hypothetical protein